MPLSWRGHANNSRLTSRKNYRSKKESKRSNLATSQINVQQEANKCPMRAKMPLHNLPRRALMGISGASWWKSRACENVRSFFFKHQPILLSKMQREWSDARTDRAQFSNITRSERDNEVRDALHESEHASMQASLPSRVSLHKGESPGVNRLSREGSYARTLPVGTTCSLNHGCSSFVNLNNHSSNAKT